MQHGVLSPSGFTGFNVRLRLQFQPKGSHRNFCFNFQLLHNCLVDAFLTESWNRKDDVEAIKEMKRQRDLGFSSQFTCNQYCRNQNESFFLSPAPVCLSLPWSGSNNPRVMAVSRGRDPNQALMLDTQ